MNTIVLSASDLVSAFAVASLVLFIAIRGSMNVVLQDIYKGNGRRGVITAKHVQRCARATSAAASIGFATLLLFITAGITLGLGVLKPTANWLPLLLPEKMLALVLVVSYTGIVSGLSIFGPEVRKAVTTLLRQRD